MNTTTKATRAMRECCGDLARGKRSFWGSETWDACRYAGLTVIDDFGEVTLTAEGEAVASEFNAKRDAARVRRNASARGRSDALRSLGMVRTPYGWE